MPDTGWPPDATEQARLIRTGAVSAIDAVRAALDRAEEVAELHATTVLFADRAVAMAADAAGPFAGVPILLKDAGQELARTPLGMGAAVLREIGYVSDITTDFAAQLEALGFVIIGKTAVPELMAGVSTEPPTGPPTRNPWGSNRTGDFTVGGSSGGSAAAVAAGIVPLAHGSDSTGSLRYPASCCGLLTLKPTAGRVSSRFPGGVADPGRMHADFVLGRSVRDLRAVLELVAPAPELEAKPIHTVATLDAMPFNLAIHPDVAEALDDVGRDLVDAGTIVESISPRFLEAYGTVLGETVPTMVDAHRANVVAWVESKVGRPLRDGDLSAPVLEAAGRGRSLDPTTIVRARTAVESAALAAARWADEFDALLLPVLDTPPWLIGSAEPDGLLAGLVCSLANFSGQPAVAVPTVQQGMPVGVQLQGTAASDESLLDLLGVIRPIAPRPS